MFLKIKLLFSTFKSPEIVGFYSGIRGSGTGSKWPGWRLKMKINLIYFYQHVIYKYLITQTKHYLVPLLRLSWVTTSRVRDFFITFCEFYLFCFELKFKKKCNGFIHKYRTRETNTCRRVTITTWLLQVYIKCCNL
jgi:hypothetical protein